MDPHRLLALRFKGHLEHWTQDIAAFLAAFGPPRLFSRGEALVHGDGDGSSIWMLLEGWAVWQRHSLAGRRQVLSILLPGELTENFPHGRKPEGSVVMATSGVAAAVPRGVLVTLGRQKPGVAALLAQQLAKELGYMTDWIVCLGSTSAASRLAYVIHSLYIRLNLIGLARGRTFRMPFSQVDMADIVSVSPVHLNRTLQKLRARHVLDWIQSEVTIHDPGLLSELSGVRRGADDGPVFERSVPSWAPMVVPVAQGTQLRQRRNA